MVIYDLMGREVTTLINNEQNAGYHNILWNGLNQGGRAVSAGIYFCRLSGNNYNQTIKMLLLK
jgi:flagellar hook assembly protein FlgD